MNRDLNSQADSELLNRPADEAYLAEWALLIQKEKQEIEAVSKKSLVVFRLHSEWLALSTLVFAEIIQERKIHYIPHKSDNILKGIVNWGGQPLLAIALDKLLDIEPLESLASLEPSFIENNRRSYQRMIAIKNQENCWIFTVNQIYGTLHYDVNLMQNLPVTIAKSKSNFLKGIFTWEEKNIGYLDEELLFSYLSQYLL